MENIENVEIVDEGINAAEYSNKFNGDLEEDNIEAEENIEMEEEKTTKSNNIFMVNHEQYELKYNLKTLKIIEKVIGKSIMGELSRSDGMLSIDDLKVAFSNALYKTEGGRVSAQHGEKIFEAVLQAKGYVYMNMLIIVTIQEDCPFLFQTDTLN